MLLIECSIMKTWKVFRMTVIRQQPCSPKKVIVEAQHHAYADVLKYALHIHFSLHQKHYVVTLHLFSINETVPLCSRESGRQATHRARGPAYCSLYDTVPSGSLTSCHFISSHFYRSTESTFDPLNQPLIHSSGTTARLRFMFMIMCKEK